MTDRDRLRILADQGDPIAIGQLYREAKRRGEAVACVSHARQDLTAPPPADEWAWLLPHVVGWAEQIGCGFDMSEWERTRSLPAQGFDGGGGWHEVTASIRLLRPRRAYQPHIKGMQWVGVFAATVIARIDAATGERGVYLGDSWGTENLTPWAGAGPGGTLWVAAGSAAVKSIKTLCDVFAPLARGESRVCALPISDRLRFDMQARVGYLMATFHIPLNEAMQLVDLAADAYASCHPDTATGEQLDALAGLVGLERWPGESDASLRERRRINLHDLPRE